MLTIYCYLLKSILFSFKIFALGLLLRSTWSDGIKNSIDITILSRD